MYERFTDRARSVLCRANREALRLNHTHTYPEHIFLGILEEKEGLAVRVLKELGFDAGRAMGYVLESLRVGPDAVAEGKLPLALPTENVIECALREAKDLEHNRVGTEHLLLGLCAAERGRVSEALHQQGVWTTVIRARIPKVHKRQESLPKKAVTVTITREGSERSETIQLTEEEFAEAMWILGREKLGSLRDKLQTCTKKWTGEIVVRDVPPVDVTSVDEPAGTGENAGNV